MSKEQVRRNIHLYRLYTIFNEPLFWGPVLIAALQNLAHMSLPRIYFQESLVLCICLVLDIPAGALADLIGRRKVVIIGRAFLFLDVFLFATMRSPTDALMANILWAIGYSMQSGADDALLYSALKDEGRQTEYKRIKGQALGARLLLISLCSIASGFLASVDLRLPLLLSVPFVLIPLVAMLLFREPTCKVEDYSTRGQVKILTEGARFILTNKKVRWIVGFAALVATVSKVWFFSYNPYFTLVGLPVEYWGVVFFLLNIIAWFSSHHTQAIEEKLGEQSCVLVMVLCLGLPILLMGLLPIQPFALLVLVQNLVRGFVHPFVSDYMNRHIASEKIRATTLSVQSSFGTLCSIVGLTLFGAIEGATDLPRALIILGLATLAFGLSSYRNYKRVIA